FAARSQMASSTTTNPTCHSSCHNRVRQGGTRERPGPVAADRTLDRASAGTPYGGWAASSVGIALLDTVLLTPRQRPPLGHQEGGIQGVPEQPGGEDRGPGLGGLTVDSGRLQVEADAGLAGRQLDGDGEHQRDRGGGPDPG